MWLVKHGDGSIVVRSKLLAVLDRFVKNFVGSILVRCKISWFPFGLFLSFMVRKWF